MAKGNPNPSPATRFKAGSVPTRGGRPKGARDRMTAAFLKSMSDDFEQHGLQVVEKVRTEDPSTYLRVFASMVPKELEILRRPLDDLSEEDLVAAIELLRQIIPEPPEAEPAPKQTH